MSANNGLWAGALSMLLQHSETGCPQAARHAARLLACLGDAPELDAETRSLCERASLRLEEQGSGGQHAGR